MATSRQHHTAPATDRSRIVELFAKSKPSYGLADVLRLTRSTAEDVNAGVDAGELELLGERGAPSFTWEDVALLALHRWTPRMIDAALGEIHAAAVPPLNRVRHISVHLPLYQIRMLNVLADIEHAGFRARLDVSDIMERQLLDLASSTNPDQMEEAIPGFWDALHYPQIMRRGNGVPEVDVEE